MTKRVPQLDAIRGMAVTLVFIHNTDRYDQTLHLGFLSNHGWMGVDLFFVLSGFLITGILLDTKDREHYFRNFYARRCLRIWPLYYAALFFMFVVVPLLRPSEAHVIFEPRSMPWWSYPIFLQNFLVPKITSATGLLAVTWSLAVEEQFYLTWPIVVRYSTEARIRQIAVAVLCLSPILRFVLAHQQVDIYANTFCRLDGLMAGALLALLLREEKLASSKHIGLAWAVFLGALVLALVTDAYQVRWIVFSFTALASTSFIYLALRSEQRWLQALLTNRFLVYTGIISYGIYLIEKIPSDVGQSFHLDRYPALFLAFTAVASYLTAILSWRVLERPSLKMKRFFEAKPAFPATLTATLPADTATG